MNALRLVLTLLVVGLAAFFFFKGVQSDAPPPAPPPAAPAAPDEKSFFPPVAGQGEPTAPAAPPSPSSPTPQARPKAEPPKGTPVAPDAVVSVDVPYREGLKSRYLVHEAQLTRDQKTNQTQWGEFVWTISTEVVKADAGDVRVKLQIDEFDFHTTGETGRLEFTSASPDQALLAIPEVALQLRPWMAVRGVPVEVALGAGGSVREIRGVQEMTNKYLDALDMISAGAAANAAWTPTAESLRQRWTDLIFPGLGGGTMKAGETRDTSFYFTQGERWATVAAGKFRVTHDDPDVFRVEFKGTPKIQEMNRAAVTPRGKAIAKMNVQSSADTYVVSWRIDRKAGRLVSAELEAKYALWTSYITPGTPGGNGVAPGFTPVFLDVERLTSVELVSK